MSTAKNKQQGRGNDGVADRRSLMGMRDTVSGETGMFDLFLWMKRDSLGFIIGA